VERAIPKIPLRFRDSPAFRNAHFEQPSALWNREDERLSAILAPCVALVVILREEFAVTTYARDVVRDANLQRNGFHAASRREHDEPLCADVVIGRERCAQPLVVLDLKLAGVEGQLLKNDAISGEL